VPRTQDLERLAPGYARWVAPELMHLTLVFLGEQPAELLPAIEDALTTAAAGVTPFTLVLGRLGHFGGGAPRVLWMEARASGPHLERLHAALSEQLAASQIAFDRKPLVAHLTLGRARRDAAPSAGRALAQRLPTLALPPPPAPFRVETVALVRSDLSPRGPRYTTLRECPLGAPPD
jgi:RNA 2',3'-cyclic 3'-phosphodiesterase